MAPSNPSIQSFYHPEAPDNASKTIQKRQEVSSNDGFTAEEVESFLKPTLPKWRPQCEYEEMDIEALIPGPKCVVLMGRIVNFCEQIGAAQGKRPRSAQGCLRVTIKDDTGAFVVSKYFGDLGSWLI